MAESTLDPSLAPRWSQKNDDLILIRSVKLVPILPVGEDPIPPAEAERRARENHLTNRGKEFVERFTAVMNGIMPALDEWDVGRYVVFAEGEGCPVLGDGWLRYVIRREDGFHHECKCFPNRVGSHGCLLSL